MVAAPASAAACSGTSGVTVVVDTGSSISTKCASGDPSSALKALSSAGFSVTYPQQYPGSVVCRINGYPSSDPCVRMPPGDAYWAFFHAKRGGSWVYSSSGVASYDPAPGTVVGLPLRVGPAAPGGPAGAHQDQRTGSHQDNREAQTHDGRIPHRRRPRPRPRAQPKTTTPTARRRDDRRDGDAQRHHPRPRPTASGSATSTPSATDDVSAGPSATASDLAAAPTSADADDGNGPGTLIAGAALVLLVAGGAAYAARKRRA